MRQTITQCQICDEHNLPKNVLIKPDKSQLELKQVCRQCADIFYGIIPIQSAKESNKGLIQTFESQTKQNSIKMNLVINTLISIKEALTKKIESLINDFRNQISNQDDILKQCKAQIFQHQTIKEFHEKYISNLNIFQNNTIKEIQSIQFNLNFNYNVKLLEELDLSILREQSEQQQIKMEQNKQDSVQSQILVYDNSNRIQKYQYWLFPKSTLKEFWGGNVINLACNQNVSAVVVWFQNFIQVYQFQNEQLKEIQRMQEKDLKQLVFFKKCNIFISLGNCFKIWKQQNDEKWVCINTFYLEDNNTQSFIINSNEDQMISINQRYAKINKNDPRGTSLIFYVFSFWKLNNNILELCKNFDSQIRIDSFNKIQDMILNDSNTKFVVASSMQIWVYEYDGIECQLIQRIHLQRQPSNYHNKLCFMSESEFVFLPYCEDNLYLYSFNNSNKLFEKVNQFLIQNGQKDYEGFPIKFIKSKNLLIVKNSNFVSILKQENNTFTLLQTIEFKTFKVKGCVSDDGQYLLTYEVTDNAEIQVRKLMMIQ